MKNVVDIKFFRLSTELEHVALKPLKTRSN